MLEAININLTGRDMVTLFLQPLISTEDVLRTFRIMPNVKTKKRLYFLGHLSRIIQRNTGCGWNAQGQLDITNREIEVVRLKINLELCSDVFWDSIFEEALGTGLNIEKNPAAIVALVIRRVKEAVAKDLYTLGYFGDKTSTDAFLSQVDGLFAQFEDLITAGLITPRNSGSGAPLGLGDSYTILDDLVTNAPQELKNLPTSMKVIKVTTSIYEDYMRYLESLGTEAANKLIVEGTTQFMFRGVKLEEHSEWTSMFPANEHVALYTVNENLVMATDVTDPENELRVWEDDKKEEMLYIKGKFKIGFSYVHEKFLALAR